LLVEVADKPETELKSALERLIGAGLLFRQGVAPDTTYIKHALVQDAAYGTLLRGQRQQLHARIAESIERATPEIAANQPGLLAQHYAKAGSDEAALKYWTIAGDLAEHRAMSREAVAHYRSARALLSSQSLTDAAKANGPRLLMKLASALQQVEGYNSAAALAAYEEARVTAHKQDQFEDYANASIDMAPLFFGGCRYKQVLKVGEELSIDYAGRLGPQTRVHLLIMRGIANFGVGEYDSAGEQTKAACALDDETSSTHQNPFGGADPAIVSRGYAAMSGLPLGRVGECLSLAQEALDIARERNHAFTLAWAQLVAARIYREVGLFDEALSVANEAIAVCERYGFSARLGTVLLQSGAAYCRIGEVERGLAATRRGLRFGAAQAAAFTCPTI
jgi:tetratricopeptide (TPR) repeat protein